MATLDLPALLALAAALGWASGLRLYAVVFVVGLAGALGWDLPEGLRVLQHPAVLGVSGILLFVEFFADKIPLVDSAWDLFHSVLRVPAGAALAAGVFGADSATMAVVAALLGGTLAASSQAAKTTTRAAINTSPEPLSNVLASLFEDGLVIAALWLATHQPVIFGILLAITVAVMVSLYLRTPLKVDVIRDRGALARMVEQGRIENVYRLQIMNATEDKQRYVISVSGLPGITIASDTEVEVLATEVRAAAVRVQIPPDAAAAGSHPIVFDVRSTGESVSRVSEKAAFLVPR